MAAAFGRGAQNWAENRALKIPYEFELAVSCAVPLLDVSVRECVGSGLE